MAISTNTTNFHNLSNEALADLIGSIDCEAKALDARLSEAKAELKARGVLAAHGERFSVARVDAARISLDTSAIRKAMGDAWCQAYEKIAGVTSFRVSVNRAALAA